MKEISLYIHIPFCERKCFYCDFTSFKGNDDKINGYITNLIKEIKIYGDRLKEYKVSTIFIGGGTPSCIDGRYIESIFKHLYENFNMDLNEVTIEVNPGTIDLEKAHIYKNIGIDRISLGVQSLNDNILKSIGRIHNSEDFFNSVSILRKSGFDNINADLMFGLPHQSMDDLKNSTNLLVDLDLKHISLYGLIIEEDTLMNRWHKKGLLALPDEDLERKMYHESIKLLEGRGYYQYEISNFSKIGYECKHNLVYWKLRPYVGIGLGSHSNLEHKRFWNFSSLKKYNESLESDMLPIEDEERISYETEMAEYCIMGLRLNEGIDKNDFRIRFKSDISDIYGSIIDRHKSNGLILEDEEKIKLTYKGLDLSNMVEVDFIPD